MRNHEADPVLFVVNYLQYPCSNKNAIIRECLFFYSALQKKRTLSIIFTCVKDERIGLDILFHIKI
mgnify:CR=1 FL=1